MNKIDEAFKAFSEVNNATWERIGKGEPTKLEEMWFAFAISALDAIKEATGRSYYNEIGMAPEHQEH